MHLRYSTSPTPIGTAFAIMSDAGLHTLDFLPDDAEVSARYGPDGAPLTHDPAALRVFFDQLDEYFAGDRRRFDLPLDLDGYDGFLRTALEAMCGIPYGETVSYGELALLAGAPGAARAAGSACARTPISVVIPAHRVVRSDGSLGEYGGRPEVKRFLLDLESGTAAAASEATVTADVTADLAVALAAAPDAPSTRGRAPSF